MGAGVQVQGKCFWVAREAGHSVWAVQDGGVRARMLLARASGVQPVYGAEDQRGVLGCQGGEEQGSGFCGVEKAGGSGMEGGDRMGVPAEEGSV